MSHSLHASAFSYHGTGCLLLGAAEAGKSSVIAQAMLHGASLVADDHVILSTQGHQLLASAPPELEGVIELRGLGIIRVPACGAHLLHLVVQLVQGEVDRLPVPQTIEFLGISLPLLKLAAAPYTAIASLLLYCKAMQEGRILPQDWRPERGFGSKPLQSLSVGSKLKS